MIWGELRSLGAKPKWGVIDHLLALEVLLRLQGVERDRALTYLRQARPEAHWDVLEWVMACHPGLQMMAVEYLPPPAHPEGVRAFLRGLAWMGLTGIDTRFATCAAHVGHGRWAVACLMDRDDCPAVDLGCYDARSIGQARMTMIDADFSDIDGESVVVAWHWRERERRPARIDVSVGDWISQ